MISFDRIPKISDEELLTRLENMIPLVCKMEKHLPIYYLLDYKEGDLDYIKNESFIWDPKLGKMVRPVNTYSGHSTISPKTVITYHRFGAPSLFKPSLAEVVAQLPEDFKGYFCVDSDDLDVYNVIDENHHFTKTFLWEKLI